MRRNRRVVDQFGTHTLDAIWPTGLLVPTATDPTQSPPLLAAPAVGHFTCYRVKPDKGSPPFTRVTVTLADQFVPATDEMTLDQPSERCARAQVNGQGIVATTSNLMCYEVDRKFPSKLAPLFAEREAVGAGGEQIQPGSRSRPARQSWTLRLLPLIRYSATRFRYLGSVDGKEDGIDGFFRGTGARHRAGCSRY